MACLVHADYPAHVLSADQARGRVRVRFLGGSAPERVESETVVSTAALSRPKGWRWLDKSPRFVKPARAPWTGEQLRELRDSWGRLPPAECARLVGRSEAACAIAMYRWWGRKGQRREDRMSSRRVAEILGWDSHRVVRLIAEGVLRREPSGVGAGANERWCVTDDALDAFLERHPERYDWRQVEAGHWRNRARAIHDADPLLSVEEAARRVYVVPSVIARHIRRGWLKAVWSDGGKSGSARRWLIRTSALASFRYWPVLERWKKLREREFRWRGLLTVEQAAKEHGLKTAGMKSRVRAGYPAERVKVGGRIALGVWPRSRVEAARLGDAA